MSGGEVRVQCLVVGAGPAGCVAAWEAAKRGVDVLIVEKRPEVGVPVRCGEGLSRSTPDLLDISPSPSWVDKAVDGAVIHSPSGRSVVLGLETSGPGVGMVIRREAFDRMLAREALGAGARLFVRTEAVSFALEERSALIECIQSGNRLKVRADVVVAADGFESQVAHWGGLTNALSPSDFDSCLQYEMVGIDVDPLHTEFFLGRKVAPGGYAWCFPKGDDIANVGLGINGSFLRGIGMVKAHLDRFVKGSDRFREGKVTEINGGAVSVCLPPERTVADRMVVVGDAARMIDPLTGGGVYNACFAALQAGKAVSEALESGDCSMEGLGPYEALWRAGLEQEIARDYIAKGKLMELTDGMLDDLIDALSGTNLSEFSTTELLRAVVQRAPSLIKGLSLS